MGFARNDNYYEFKSFTTIIKELTEEQEKGMTYMYLVKCSSGDIVGRVNLVSVVRGGFNKAELGYRVGEKHQGKGYATAAVKLALTEAKRDKNRRIRDTNQTIRVSNWTKRVDTDWIVCCPNKK